jgi:cellulose biosynthesis protein BcsQ
VKILATYNIKGGVGKTATAVNLAWLSAHAGNRTVVWDLDPQGAATFYFRVAPRVKGGGGGLVQRKRELEETVKGTDFPHLDLIPADFSYRNLDLALADTKRPEKRLEKLLRPLADEYDVAFLDCPPSISLVSESVFHAADALLIPLIPTTLSLRTFEQLVGHLGEEHLDRALTLPFFSMVDRRRRLHRDTVDALLASEPRLLRTEIPYASAIEQMGVHRAPLGSYAPKNPAAEAYERLWAEVEARTTGVTKSS